MPNSLYLTRLMGRHRGRLRRPNRLAPSGTGGGRHERQRRRMGRAQASGEPQSNGYLMQMPANFPANCAETVQNPPNRPNCRLGVAAL